jgi:hypothetical protein
MTRRSVGTGHLGSSAVRQQSRCKGFGCQVPSFPFRVYRDACLSKERASALECWWMSNLEHGEHRRTPRKRPLSLVYVELAHGNGGMMRDLSIEGFAVRAMMPVLAGENTPFSFSLNEDVKVAGEGHILWVEEGGRVAGVQFISVSEQARDQILDWMTRPDVLPKPESGEKAEPPETPTFEQLRQEMYSVPPRPEGMHPFEPPTKQATTDTVAKAHHETISGSTDVAGVSAEPASPSELPDEPLHPPESEPSEEPFEPPAAPALPRLTLTPKVVEPISRQERPSPPPREISSGKGHWKPTLVETPPAQEPSPAMPEHPLPDISAILMQPRRAQTPQPQTHMGPVETLASWNAAPAVEEPWTERLSLSSAITVMMIIAMLAGLYVFHRNVGQGLIWLGEAMGGIAQGHAEQTQGPSTPVPQLPAEAPHSLPSPAETPSSASAASSPQQQSEASPGPPSSLSGNDNAAERAGAGAPNSSSTVTPLSGVSSPSNSELGQTEYAQAMQILHGKNANVDAPEALRLLWIAVEKGNSNAELELAEMYWRGRGVIQNCDQTLILLTAAARKGSAEAQRRLLQYRKEGCE